MLQEYLSLTICIRINNNQQGESMNKVLRYLSVLLFIFSSTASVAGSSTICYYGQAFKIDEGKISLGYTGSGGEFRSQEGYDRKLGIFFNSFELNAFKGSRYTFKAVSRYFKPRIVVASKRKKRNTESRVLGNTSKGWVSEVVYETDRSYPDERIKVYVSSMQNNHSKKLRGAEIFLQYTLAKERCETERSEDKPPPKYVNPVTPGLGGCPSGQYRSTFTGACVNY